MAASVSDRLTNRILCEDRGFPSYGEWFRWLAKQPPSRRILTQEELHIIARDFDRLYANQRTGRILHGDAEE